MEFSAQWLIMSLGLSIYTDVTACLTAVRVVVKSLLVQGVLATWGFREADRHWDSTKDRKSVGNLAGFEKDYLFVVDSPDCSVCFLSHWE